MGRCTGHHDMTEITLKTHTIHSIILWMPFIIATITISSHCSIRSVQESVSKRFRFDTQRNQYSFRGLMMAIATRLISHFCPLFRQWVCRKAASSLERIEYGVLVIEINSRKAWIGALATAIWLK